MNFYIGWKQLAKSCVQALARSARDPFDVRRVQQNLRLLLEIKYAPQSDELSPRGPTEKDLESPKTQKSAHSNPGRKGPHSRNFGRKTKGGRNYDFY